MVSVQQLRTIWSAGAGISPLPESASPRASDPAVFGARLCGRMADAARAVCSRRIVRAALWILSALILLWSLVPQALGLAVRSRCYTHLADVPAAPVAIVFGAGVTSRGRMTPVLRERVKAAIALYQAHKVQKLLMTGDDAHVYHNEPWAMRRYAIKHGIPATDIVCDFAGFRTYDSCYRARRIFGVGRAILVTQSFHLPRAVFVARALGIDACGYAAANPLRRSSSARMALRENSCMLAGLSDLALRRRPRFLGRPEPIFAAIAQR